MEHDELVGALLALRERVADAAPAARDRRSAERAGGPHARPRPARRLPAAAPAGSRRPGAGGRRRLHRCGQVDGGQLAGRRGGQPVGGAAPDHPLAGPRAPPAGRALVQLGPGAAVADPRGRGGGAGSDRRASGAPAGRVRGGARWASPCWTHPTSTPSRRATASWPPSCSGPRTSGCSSRPPRGTPTPCPWELLADAARRGTHLALVLDRVDPGAETAVGDHLRQMLADAGLASATVIVVPEVELEDGLLPEAAIGPIADVLDRGRRRTRPSEPRRWPRRGTAPWRTCPGARSTWRPPPTSSRRRTCGCARRSRRRTRRRRTRSPTRRRTGRCCAARCWRGGRTSSAPASGSGRWSRGCPGCATGSSASCAVADRRNRHWSRPSPTACPRSSRTPPRRPPRPRTRRGVTTRRAGRCWTGWRCPGRRRTCARGRPSRCGRGRATCWASWRRRAPTGGRPRGRCRTASTGSARS